MIGHIDNDLDFIYSDQRMLKQIIFNIFKNLINEIFFNEIYISIRKVRENGLEHLIKMDGDHG